MPMFGDVIDVFGERNCTFSMSGGVINMYGDMVESVIAFIEADGGQLGSVLERISTQFEVAAGEIWHALL